MEIKLLLTRHPEVNGDFQTILLNVDYDPGELPSFYSPGAPDGYEITEAFAENSRTLDWEEILAIDLEYTDEIWDLIIDTKYKAMEEVNHE